jgi:hypothetical protein
MLGSWLSVCGGCGGGGSLVRSGVHRKNSMCGDHRDCESLGGRGLRVRFLSSPWEIPSSVLGRHLW